MVYRELSSFKTEQELWEYCNENNLVIVDNKFFMDADDYYLGGD